MQIGAFDVLILVYFRLTVQMHNSGSVAMSDTAKNVGHEFRSLNAFGMSTPDSFSKLIRVINRLNDTAWSSIF